MLISIGLIVLGLVLLVIGGEMLLRAAVALAILLRLTPAVIGLTVVAAGTSVPELAVSGIAAYQQKADIAVANVVGSNIFNIALIIGMCALIRPIAIAGNTIRLEYPVLALVTLLCLVLARDGEIDRLDAVMFLATYVCFTAYLIGLVRQQVTSAEAEELAAEVTDLARRSRQPRPWVAVALVLVGAAVLGAGAQSTVTGAVGIARVLGWSERVIGLTIVSAGTGLPEVVASVLSSMRGRSDVAIGNVIGSNLFNILVILGLSATLSPLPVQQALVTFDSRWMLALTVGLFPLMVTRRCLNRWEGGLLLGVYVVYLGMVLASRG